MGTIVENDLDTIRQYEEQMFKLMHHLPYTLQVRSMPRGDTFSGQECD